MAGKDSQEQGKAYDPFTLGQERESTYAEGNTAPESEGRGDEDALAKARGDLRDELAKGRTGEQDGAAVRDAQTRIAEGVRAASGASTAEPPTPVSPTPEKLDDRDPRVDPTVAAPIGGGDVPSVGPGPQGTV